MNECNKILFHSCLLKVRDFRCSHQTQTHQNITQSLKQNYLSNKKSAGFHQLTFGNNQPLAEAVAVLGFHDTIVSVSSNSATKWDD